MDENKEFLTSENEEETKVNSDTDTDNNENHEELTNEYTSEFSEEIAETEADVQDVTPVEYNAETATVQTKKKSIIQIPIIISAVILVLVALGFLVFKCFFNTSIIGTWTVSDTATPDEASTEEEETSKSYYIFENDGTAKIAIGTFRMEGTYTITTNDEGTRSVEINIPSALQGTFEFEVSGNELQGRKLVLTNPDYGQSIDFESTKMIVPEMKVEEDFEPSEKLTGDWSYDDGYYMMNYELREDGTASVNQSDVIFADGVYTYTEDMITIKYYTDSEVTMELEYQLDGETLIVNGIPFTRVTDASADEA